MRSGLAGVLLLVLCGCSDERCLELHTDGVQPSDTTWIVAAGTQEDEPRPGMFMFVPPGSQPPPGWHTASCIGAFGGATWHLLVWFDDSGQDPQETYCRDPAEHPDADCSPRPGQPFGEKTFHFGRGLNTVTVTVHPP